MAKTWKEQSQELMSKCYDILETLEDYDMTGDENVDIKSYYKDLNELRDSETDLLDADRHSSKAVDFSTDDLGRIRSALSYMSQMTDDENVYDNYQNTLDKVDNALGVVDLSPKDDEPSEE